MAQARFGPICQIFLIFSIFPIFPMPGPDLGQLDHGPGQIWPNLSNFSNISNFSNFSNISNISNAWARLGPPGPWPRPDDGKHAFSMIGVHAMRQRTYGEGGLEGEGAVHAFPG